MIDTKSYFANTVEEGLALARKEFGEEALLIESKRTRPGERRLGAYEIVVGAPASPSETAAPASPAPREASPGHALSQEISGLRLELERMAGLLGHLTLNTMGLRQGELEPVVAELTRADLSPDLVQQVVHRTASAVAGQTQPPLALLRRAVSDQIRLGLRCEPRIGKPGAERRTVALVGPPGTGKTTTLVKLAMRFGVEQRKSTGIITTDTYRIAAAGQLKSYAAILGLPCLVVEHAGALANALDEFQRKDLVLIDTPGFSTGDWDLASDWGRCLMAHEQIDIQLVLNAAMRSTDIERMLANWCAFAPQGLIFTHLDETAATGGVLTAALRSSLPLSYFGTGQSVPEDLEPASPEILLAFLEKPLAARSAAA
jgi:flagellar biosynthesis protein FlhF